ncbi:MAG: alpha-glucan family phosphorylase [Planctomycetales bacterium]|nr:alpha-glucan family phosphorylase [Planctomycetales bacterium]
MTSQYFPLELPPSLHELPKLALDLRWSTSLLTRRIWERLDAEGWRTTENPYLLLLNASQEQLTKASTDEELLSELSIWRTKAEQYFHRPAWFSKLPCDTVPRQIAYFSMEFGLSEALPIYSGGLGLLAGDHLKSASDLGVPIVGIGILYQQGYFRQVLSREGEQREAFPFNDPSTLPVVPLLKNGQWQRVALDLPGRTLILRAWQAQVGRVPLYLLDSNDPANSPWDRGITASLYDAGRDKRLLQEIVLGIGGWRLLTQLGMDVDVCHLNEGHAAFAVLARAERLARQTGVSVFTAFRATRAGNVFTTHTPVAAAFDTFDPDLVAHYAEPFVESLDLPMDRLLDLGRCNTHDDSEPFNMAFLAMRGCSHVNAVSQLHGHVSRKIFAKLYSRWPQEEVPVTSITNGVHIPTWNSEPARKLWVASTGDNGWFEDIASCSDSLHEIDSAQLWNMRSESRKLLIEYVRSRYYHQIRTSGAPPEEVHQAAKVLDLNALTLGFARRFTEYKRPTLMLYDSCRLRNLLTNPSYPVQLIVAGKSHPNDEHGKSMVREMNDFARLPELKGRVIFLEDYDIALARHLAGGIDVWLNTPRRPAEACGTSGMKTLFNGGLNLSVLDGWWDEAYQPQVGWEIGEGKESEATIRDPIEAEQLLNLLEHQIIPEFYDRDEQGLPMKWVARIQHSMRQLTGRFSSDRMVKDYVTQAYAPAAKAVARRLANNCQVASDLYEWHVQIENHWHELHFGEANFSQKDGCWLVSVPLYFGELPSQLVKVQLYAQAHSQFPATTIEMHCSHPLIGSVNGFLYVAEVSCDRPATDYTPRAIPFHSDGIVPIEESWILWQR